MTIVRKWTGDEDDNAFDQLDSGITVDESGIRPPRLLWPDTANTLQARYNGLTLNDLAYRREWSITGSPSATFYLGSLRNSSNGTLIDLIMTSTGKLRIRANNTNYDAATVTLVAGTRYRFEFVRSGTTGTAYLYEGDQDTAIASVSATVPGDTCGALWVGQITSLAVPGLTADDIALSDQPFLIGPVSDAPPVDPGDGSGNQDLRIAIIGDSLTFQNGNGEAAYRSLLQGMNWYDPNIWFYACSGKGIDWRDSNNRLTVEDIEQARTDLGAEPDIWVISLGTNGAAAATTATVNLVLNKIAEAGEPGKIIWVGLGDRDATQKYQDFNAMASPLVEATPDGEYLDYQAFASSIDPSNFNASDGLHMPPAGYALRNAYVVDAIGAAPATSAIAWYLFTSSGWTLLADLELL